MEAIKDRSDGLIKDPWPSLQLFLAKKDEGCGPWLTQLDAVQGVSGTSGYRRLLFPDAKLRDVGLARGQLGEVNDNERVAGKGPVHVLVKLPEQVADAASIRPEVPLPRTTALNEPERYAKECSSLDEWGVDASISFSSTRKMCWCTDDQPN
ncbi:hypothetical protein PR003_g21396 [Phytophthora rubi]|nr:hypothetical protein PR003_g21396 [Phytophthora rubi]